MRNKEQQSDHIYYSVFWQVHGFSAIFLPASENCAIVLGPKPF
jgi:hypothetical protein